MTYRIINFRQSEEWTKYVRSSVNYDFYHTWHCHSLETNGEPFLFVYEEEDVFIALPLLKRKISNSDLYDLTSVYGYAGPISNKEFRSIADEILENFKNCFLDFMRTEKYVCAFSRLNPFTDQKILMEKIGGTCSNGKTVYMDLSVPVEQQRTSYEKRLGREIRHLRKTTYNISEAVAQEEIKVFAQMYNENMLRLRAESRYFHDEEYFSKLIQSQNDCKLIVIYDGEKMICGAIITCSGNIIRNHLSATSATYINQSPSKLLTDEISLIGRKLGKRYFHLGGGLGGHEDSLFKFKAAFSPLYLEDLTWKFVSDMIAYDKLVKACKDNINTSYFPLYRSIAV